MHIDVMDGKFVSLTGLNGGQVELLKTQVEIPMDVHLMTEELEPCIERFAAMHVHSILFHLEAQTQQKTFLLLQKIKSYGVRCGLAISPHTPVEGLALFLPCVDEILLMSTTPGEAHSVFTTSAFERLDALHQLVQEQNPEIVISVDGGINERLAALCVQHGADKIIIGRSFFNSAAPRQLAQNIRKLQSVSL